MTSKLQIITLESFVDEPAGGSPKGDLLFLHGAWHAAWCWKEHMLPYFAKQGYRATAMSLRGHGGSEGRMKFATISDYVDDLIVMVDSMALPPVLIAHSMGGFIAQHALVRLQGRLKGLVLMAPVPPSGVKRTTVRIALKHPGRFTHATFAWSLFQLVASPKLVRELFFRPDTPEAIVEACHRRLGDESYSAFLTMLFNRPNLSTVDDLPVLVLGGGEDKIFLPDEVRETAAAFNVKAHFFEDMPHDMMLAEEWKDVANVILQFLEPQTQ